MAEKPDNPPAFPVHGGYGRDIDDPRNRILGGGLTKREYIAAKIMAAMCADAEESDRHFRFVAVRAVVAADALIAALNAGGQR
jgi:hypothetical protein